MIKNRDTSRSRSTSDSSRTYWFFLDGENQHGPFSAEELRGYFDIGALAKQTLLWHSGMPEWLPVDQVAEFSKYSETLPSVATPRSIEWSSEMEMAESIFDGTAEPVVAAKKMTSITVAPIESPEKKPETFAGENEDFPTYESVLRFATGGNFDEAAAPSHAVPPELDAHEVKWKKFTDRQVPPQNYVAFEKPKFSGLNAKALTAVGVFGGVVLLVAGISAYRQGSEPAVFSKVSHDSNYELKTALHSSLKIDGPKVAVALSIADVYAPFFIVGTNLPNGQVLEVAIDGVADTLVDRFKVSVHTTTTVKDGVALTPVFRQEQGIPYPSGSYRVRVSCPQCETLAESASAPLADKVFPVNTKDMNYEANLGTYHKKLRAQAKDELTELKQVSETLESQLNETDSAFHQIHLKKNVKSAKREWTEFHDHWNTLQRQIETLFARWTPAALDGGYYYAGLYSTLKKAGDNTSALHDEQNKFMTDDMGGSKSAEAFLSRAEKTRSALDGLRTKIHQTEEMLPNANGMPPTLD